MTDPIADYLTRIRNAVTAGHKVVEIPASKVKTELTRILHEKGYILSYKIEEGQPSNTIKIALKYHPDTKRPAIKKLIRVSSPGLRRYTNVDKMPRVLNGLGIAIISTSKGIITDKEAKTLNVGGDHVTYINLTDQYVTNEKTPCKPSQGVSVQVGSGNLVTVNPLRELKHGSGHPGVDRTGKLERPTSAPSQIVHGLYALILMVSVSTGFTIKRSSRRGLPR